MHTQAKQKLKTNKHKKDRNMKQLLQLQQRYNFFYHHKFHINQLEQQDYNLSDLTSGKSVINQEGP